MTFVKLGLLLLLQWTGLIMAHPDELTCNGLSAAVAAHRPIMTGVPKMVPWSSAPGGKLVRVGQDDQWTNYSITMTWGVEFVLEVTGGSQITDFGHDDDDEWLTSCVWKPCSTQLFATEQDCIKGCVFGISRMERNASTSLLVGWSRFEATVSYASAPLTG